MTAGPAQKQPPRFAWLRPRTAGRGFQAHSLTTRLIVVILMVLLVSHCAGFMIVADERRHALRDAARGLAAHRLVAIVNLLETTPPSLHGEVTAAASSPGLHFKIDAEPLVDGTEERNFIEARLQREIAGALERPEQSVRLDLQSEWDRDRSWFEPERWRAHPPPPFLREWHDEDDRWDRHEDDDDDDEHEHGHYRAGKPRVGLLASIRLADGTWLNAASAIRAPSRPIGGPAVLSLVLSAAVVSLAVAWLVRRTMRPLRALTDAANRFGQGERPDPVPEDGPADIRRLIRAFNTMRDRIDRFVRERMQMLAALSHDLRTPITTLRLRAELLENEEERDRFIATLDELQVMTEEVLAFVRSESATEETQATPISGFVDSILTEFREAGASITFTAATPDPAPRLRRLAIKRAVRNLLSNAVRHGDHVSVQTRSGPDGIAIEICDDGPGLPEDQIARAFEPFVRLDPARGQDTGGVGLGLAIARSIARAHGGDIALSNRPEGGLCAVLSLPTAGDTDGIR